MAGSTHFADGAPPEGLLAREALAAGAAQDLDAALIAAHAAHDGDSLVALYASAADRAEAEGGHEAAAFYLTHAYVFALESGHPAADRLHARLKAAGREE